MKHNKRYKRTGTGVDLLCGTEVIADNPYRGTNFSVYGCPICGMEVRTIGCSPDTDRIQELIPVKIGNQFLAQ